MGAARTIMEIEEAESGGEEACRSRVDGLGLGRFAGIAGRGATGVVVRIEGFPGRDGPVVLKLLRRELLRDTTAVARFRRELAVHHRLWSVLQAPRLVPCLGVGEAGGPAGLFGVFPFYADGSLEDAADRMPLADALRCLADAAEGLGALHGLGYIHRDLCPANIFVAGEGGVLRGRLGDLGVAIPVRGNTIVRHTVVQREMRFSVGHPGYVDPWHGGTPLADLFGLGAALYRLLAGSDPQGPPPPEGLRLPASCRGHVHGELCSRAREILVRLSAEAADRRFGSANEAARAIQELAGLAGDEAARGLMDSRSGRKLRRWAASGLVAAALAGTLVTLGGGRSGVGGAMADPGAAGGTTLPATAPAPAPAPVAPAAERDEGQPVAAGEPGRSGSEASPEMEPAPASADASRREGDSTGEGDGESGNAGSAGEGPGASEPVVSSSPLPGPGALIRAASLHVERRELLAAETLLRRALAVAPGEARAASLLALVLSRKPDGAAEAARVLRSALQREPGASRLRLQLSRLLAAGGDVDGALRVLDDAPPGQGDASGIARWRVTLERLRRRSG